MNDTKKQLYEKYKALPKDIQNILLDENLGPVITLMCKDTGVGVEKSLDVEDAVIHVLIGDLHPKDFVQTIAQKAELPNETAQKIAREVTESIFEQVEDSLKKVHGINTSISDVVLGSQSDQKEPVDGVTSYKLQATGPTLPGSAASVPPAPQAPKPHDEPTSQYFASSPQKSRPNDEEPADDVDVPASIFEEKLKKASEQSAKTAGESVPADKQHSGGEAADPYREPTN